MMVCLAKRCSQVLVVAG